MANYERTPAEQEFVTWLDSVSTPVDTSRPLVDHSRDYPREKHIKREKIRHHWLMKHNVWYAGAHREAKRQEQLRLEAELEGREYVEPPELTSEDEGFWQQFDRS